jgi:hypothetical protein
LRGVLGGGGLRIFLGDFSGFFERVLKGFRGCFEGVRRVFEGGLSNEKSTLKR